MRALVYMASRDKVDVDSFLKGIQYALEKLVKLKFGCEITAVANFKRRDYWLFQSSVSWCWPKDTWALGTRTGLEKIKLQDRFVFVQNKQRLSIIPVQYLLSNIILVRHWVHYLQGELLWLNFFEPLQHVTISFKVDSTLYHLIHVAFLKSDIIRNIDELYVHFTLKRYKTLQSLTKLEIYTVVVSHASLCSRPGETPSWGPFLEVPVA